MSGDDVLVWVWVEAVGGVSGLGPGVGGVVEVVAFSPSTGRHSTASCCGVKITEVSVGVLRCVGQCLG